MVFQMNPFLEEDGKKVKLISKKFKGNKAIKKEMR